MFPSKTYECPITQNIFLMKQMIALSYWTIVPMATSWCR